MDWINKSAVGLLAGVALCIGSAGVLHAAETTLKTVLNADIRSTDPGVNRDSNTDAVMLQIVEGLVGLREGGDVGMMLADDVSVSDDGRTYTFTLRDGITFHNGEPMNAEDVEWTWRRYLDPQVEFRCGDDFREDGSTPITEIEVVDDRTISFTIAEPNALFLMIMARPDCASTGIYHKDSVNEGDEWVSPIGTGPFKLGTWRKGEFIELEKFADYAARSGGTDGLVGNKTPLVDKIRYTIVPDGAAAKAALIAGDIDILPDVGVTDRVELESVDGIETTTSPTMAANGLLFQTTDPVMSDVRLRKAIAMSLDMDGIVGAITGGALTKNNSAVPAASSFHGSVQDQGFERDLAQVKALLEEAGYSGETIKLMTTQEYNSMYDLAVFSQAMASEAGINMELEVVEWATLLDAYRAGNYQVMAFGYSARLDPALSYDMFMGSKAKQPRKVWDDPVAQELLEQAKREGNPDARQALFDKLHEMHIDSVTFVNLYEWPAISAMRSSVDGFSAWAGDKPRYWGVGLNE